MTDLIRALFGSTDAPELTFRRSYPSPVASLRDACTDPDRLARWFGTVNPVPTSVGDRFDALLSDDPDDKAAAEVLQCTDDLVQISWTWQGEKPSVITARFVSTGDESSELVLHHALTEAVHTTGYGGGWEQLLASLERQLTGGGDASGDEQLEKQAAAHWKAMAASPMTLEQTIEAPVDRVWQAFASSEGLKSWWWKQWPDVTVDADVRPGGQFAIAAPSMGISLTGDYLVVDEPHRLAHTWRWADGDGVSRDEAVDLRFEPAGDSSTVVKVRHTGPWSDGTAAENYRQGWQFTLGQLAEQVAAS